MLCAAAGICGLQLLPFFRPSPAPPLAPQSFTPIPAPGSRLFPVLDSVSGVLKPGRLTLLLGHPGSGRSMLLRALAGQLRHDTSVKVRSLASSAPCCDPPRRWRRCKPNTIVTPAKLAGHCR